MHITKISLYRKLSILSLAVLLFATSFLGSYNTTAHAVGVDTVVKLTGGKAVVRALSEKAGMSLSKSQLDNTVALIEKRTFDGDQNAIDFVNKANQLSPSDIPTKSGFKKYVLDPMAWLTGLDLIFDAVEAFQTGYDSGTPVELFQRCPNPIAEKRGTFPYFANVVEDGQNLLIMWQNPDHTITYDDPNFLMVVHAPGAWEVYTQTESGWNKTNDNVTYSIGIGSTSLNASGLKTYQDESVCGSPVSEGDVINTSNVDNSVTNNFDNDTYNTNTTYNIEIDLPDIINYDDPTPWNEKDPNITTEVGPDPEQEQDSDNDGIPDDTDSDSDEGNGFLENLIPILALIALFDLLKSVIFYLARMFEFILTIPLIEAKPIDNIAFEWFRNAEIVGVEIYSVVSLLASIGLAFAVYKVVRRLLP